VEIEHLVLPVEAEIGEEFAGFFFLVFGEFFVI